MRRNNEASVLSGCPQCRDPDLQIRMVGGGGGHPDPEIREGWVLRVPRAPLLDPPLVRKADFDCIFKLPAWPICRETG